jgi:hypothetical protein
MAVELTEAQINGRFQVLDRPLAAPGKCACCGAVDRPVIDFGFDLDFYGVVYICVEDFKAGAQLLGLVDVSQLVQPPDPIVEIRDRINGYIKGIDDLNRGLDFWLNDRSWSILPLPVEESTELQAVDGPELSDDSSDESGDDTTPEQVSESIVNEGTTSVPSRSSNGPDTLFDFG